MQDETKTSLDYAMSLLDGLSQDLLSSCFIPVCGGSQYLVPVDAMRVSDGELAELRGGHSTSTEAQKAFVKRYLVNDTSTVVGVVVSDDVAAEDSDGWLAIQPSDCKVYRVHADGWVESESTSY